MVASKLCKAKVSCEVCSLTHPTLLHIKTKDVVADAEKRKNDSDGQTVLNAFICAQSEGRETTGKMTARSQLFLSKSSQSFEVR